MCYTTNIKMLGACAFVATLAMVASVQAATIALSGSDATGYLSFVGFQNEFSGTYPPGGEAYPGDDKGYQYPYFWNPTGGDGGTGVWSVIVAEKLSTDSVYVQESSFTTWGKDVTDADFHLFNVGSIAYDEGLLTGIGDEVIGIADLTLDIDETDFNPMDTPRDVNNEFHWIYRITPSNLSGSGLMFKDGVLTSIDLTADLEVNVLLGGFEAAAFTWFTDSGSLKQVGSLTLSGNQLTFNFDQTGDANTFFGLVEDARIVINRSGAIDAVVIPEPVSLICVGLGCMGLLLRRSRRVDGQ